MITVLLASILALQPAQPAEARDPLRSELILELSEVIGAAHFYALSCEGRDAQYWRDRMIEFLTLEAEDSYRLREAMIDAFNDGYRRADRGGSRCDANMREARERASRRGTALAERLGEPYL